MRPARNFHAEMFFSLSAIALLSSGCAGWSRPARSAATELPQGEMKHMRVQLKDGRHVVLDHARVVGDSLVGEGPPVLPFDPPRHRDELRPGPRTAFALADIKAFDVQKTSVAKTVGLVALIGAIGFLAVGLAIQSTLEGL